MLNPTRQEIVKLLEELSAPCPEYRFGQLVLNLLAFLAREDGDSRVGRIEDEELVEAARKHLADWRGTRPGCRLLAICHGANLIWAS